VNSYIKQVISKTKKIHIQLKKMYPDLPKIKIEFKNLNGKSGGYLETARIRGTKLNIPQRIIIDNSGMFCFDPDYVLCHEFAHLILCVHENSLRHTKKHAHLTYKLAKKFNLV